MEVVSYIRGDDKYTIEPIVDVSQVDLDMATVMDVIQDTDLDYYRDNMLMSIDQNLSYAIFKNGERVGFVYNRLEDNLYIGCSINIWDHVAMIVGLKHIFDICDKHKIVFAPHTINMKDFVSMATGTSIRIFNTTDTSTVTILRDDIYPRGARILKYLGVTNE